MMLKDSNWAFKYIKEFNLNFKKYIRILMCKLWGLESLSNKISKGPPKVKSIFGFIYILLKITSNLCNAHESLIKNMFLFDKLIFFENLIFFFSFVLYINMKFGHYDSYLLKFINIVFIYEVLNMKLDNYDIFFYGKIITVVINRYSL